jgi:hypothetical protein
VEKMIGTDGNGGYTPGGWCDRTTSEMRQSSPKIISGILDEARMRKHNT